MQWKRTERQIQKDYESSRARYLGIGVDTEKALQMLCSIPISLHCWQGDDVGGFEARDSAIGGGLAVTGNHPGRARNASELRSDLDKAYSLIPGRHRLNLHSIYAETDGRKVERNNLQPEHFEGWIDWAKANNHGIDFNPTCFAHPKAKSGFTLSSYDAGVRRFWLEHCIACRKIGEHIGRKLRSPCVTNVWIPDGFKDIPIDRKTPRLLLRQSLDAIFAEKLDPRWNLDAVESKLFGIGSESYVVGSHEFYLGYALAHKKLLCLDSGHFHPTEGIADKISSVMEYLDGILLHVSRGVRWDSDHVVILSDELQAVAQELVRGGFIKRTHIGLDYFDASINRVAAWVIGTRCMIRALLSALLEPIDALRKTEHELDYTSRLALIEELKAMPSSAVWDYYCMIQGVPVSGLWIDSVRDYEKTVLSSRA